MSEMNDNITKTIAWMNENILFKALVLKEDKAISRNIPMNVSAPYHFFYGSFSDIPVVWVIIKHYEDISPSILKRHSEIINNACGLIPIFIIQKIESYKIQRLTKTHVNFIIKNKVIYLPDLLFVVRNQTKTELSLEKVGKEIPAMAQLMVLYQIQKKSLNGLSSKQIALLFNVSYSTIKRAVAWLIDNGVIRQKGKKEKVILFNYEGKTLWNFCEKFLRNPIEISHFSTETARIKEFKIAGESALSRYTLLSENTLTIAISKKELTRMNKQFKNWDRYGDCQVQTWIYDPKILADGDSVDRLSLYLSLKENYDERVQIELDNMINDLKW